MKTGDPLYPSAKGSANIITSISGRILGSSTLSFQEATSVLLKIGVK